MAPIRQTSRPVLSENPVTKSNVFRRAMTTRTSSIGTKVLPVKELRPKRKANSPLKSAKDVKQLDMGTRRAAFGDITNATTQQNVNDKAKIQNGAAAKKVTVQTKYLPTVKSLPETHNVPLAAKRKENVAPVPTTRLAAAAAAAAQNKRNVRVVSATSTTHPTNVKRYQDKKLPSIDTLSEKSEDSLYVSAEDISSTTIDEPSSTIKSSRTVCKLEKLTISDANEPPFEKELSPGYVVPPGVNDFDKEIVDDIFSIPNYAMDVFEYYKEREAHFKIPDYMSKQQQINTHMRALLVDWMVEVQESFELNHETLYLAVKLVDICLSKLQVTKDMLQLVGAASLFIAAKYDERVPPLLDDFIYICDGAYNKKQMFRMEISVLKTVEFELGMPLSYRFLRRYARCAKVSMPTLTLARFILEYSLLDYSTVTESDSKLAAAALYIALRMDAISEWTETLEYYSGYKLNDLIPQIKLLNGFLHKAPSKESITTIRNKYSHKIFFEVAKKPLIELFPTV